MNLSTFEAFKHAVVGEGMVELSGERLVTYQHVLLMMLRDIDTVCREEGIAYTLSGGTCLGAVRHHGFIPWDDDVDLNMPRAEFERFAPALLSRFGDKYWVHAPGRTPGYDLALARVRLKGTVVRCRDDFDSDECGAYVDVFILDDLPDGVLARVCHGFVSMALGFAYSCRRFAAHAEQYLALVPEDSSTSRAFKLKVALGSVFSFRSVEAWVNTWDRWNGRCRNSHSCYIGIPAGRKHYFGELYRREDFFPVREGEFCGMRVPLPANPDAYMRALYGPDYMTPPAEADRETHVVYEFDLGEYGAASKERKAIAEESRRDSALEQD